ncbi:Putative Function: the S. cerevisiae homolog GAP1 encodes the low affinitiy [Aspergillus calidoustus]|uniref:Putative Function: the S. cerevisiae homolog GAP1 encodes the low affinitiy n=1 Tax=Aspergillus calidoustus TaxID=454130 RepID=A0A0U5G3G0_ASPCI|nr:Putative Function: the S. cerevisiae homolog GAP1 encodes the low affinitiy [Aspergillus calidoustus]
MGSHAAFEHIELSPTKAPGDTTVSNSGNLPTNSKGETVDHGAETQLHRSLGTRHLTMIALGSAIGMGMWLGSGKSLANGGPASLFVGFLISSSVVWSVSHSIGEMAIMYPLPSGFVQWSSIFISPAAGFALGWGYWFSYWITIANELQGVVTVLNYWTDQVPKAALITIFWVVIILINVWAVRFFAEVEVFSSTVKFGWMFIAIIALVVVTAGRAPQGGPIGFRYWNEQTFNNGFKGFISVLPTCVFGMAGSENAALVASEVSNPRRSVPRAIGSIWLRLGLFYILGSLMITLTVNPKDPNLFGGSGSNASPFVIAFNNAGIPVMAHITNAVILISVVSTGSISGYGGSRMLMGLAHVRMNHKIFGKADRMGRPWAGYIATIGIGGALAYLNVSHTGAEVFTWLSNLVSLLTLFGWGMISLCHLRFRYAWKAQGRDESHLPWKTWTYPYATWWGFIWCVGLIVFEFYLSIWPLHEEPSVKNFFANYVSVVAVAVIWAAAQIWYRCPVWVDGGEIDLDRDRRIYAHDVTEESTPARKRLLGRLSLLLE